MGSGSGVPAAWSAPSPGLPPPPGSSAPPHRRGKGRLVLLGVGILLVALVAFVGLVVLYVAIVAGAADDNVPNTAWLGECYGNDGSFEPVSCDGPHHYEVFDIVEYEADLEYPGRFDRSVGNDVCDESFEAYTGDSIMDLSSPYDYAEIYPTPEEWEDGVRLVPCALLHTELDRFDRRVGDLDAVFGG